MCNESKRFSKKLVFLMASIAAGSITSLASHSAIAGPWPVFSAIGTAGVMCTMLPQDSTPHWETSLGRLIIFDDGRPGKELCYISFTGKPDTVSISVTGGDGTTLAGSGPISIDVTPTYVTTSIPANSTPASALTLTSSAFAQNGAIPVAYTCDANKDAGFIAAYGTGAFPPLAWSNVPAGTQSFALIVHDVTANYTHGVFYNIPAATTSLPNNWNMQGASIGLNDFGETDADQNGYGGPCPPANHTYEYRLYALSNTLALPTMFPTKSDIEAAMQGKILGQSTWAGTYGPRQVIFMSPASPM